MLTRLPKSETLEIKEGFEKRYRALLGKGYDNFMEHSLSYITKGIRINTLKASIKEIRDRLKSEWKLEPIHWINEGFWIKGERTDIGNTLEHALGYIYVQEAASMIPTVVLGPAPHDTVLDICAAPGSKSTQMAAMMENKGVLVANDITGNRTKILELNLQRCGVLNAIITKSRGQALRGFEFDKILVDAPCSGTGTIRRNPETLKIWNPDMVKRLALVQRQLITTAFEMLKDGGAMVYSTCSLEPEENEGVVDFLLKKFENAKIEKIALEGLRSSPPVLEFEGKSYNGEIKNSLRIWPQDNNTEGFFVARITKN